MAEPGRHGSRNGLHGQAIYYEANSEPFAGQLAVAQVILNRLRHPRFPKTICGVIHQGNERATGCQFTLPATDHSPESPARPGCSGHARGTGRAAWGRVGQAGQATHYHTIWISPSGPPNCARWRSSAIMFLSPAHLYAGYVLSP
jgi:spore germination cell wall hydrolase CwlJ-like protein